MEGNNRTKKGLEIDKNQKNFDKISEMKREKLLGDNDISIEGNKIKVDLDDLGISEMLVIFILLNLFNEFDETFQNVREKNLELLKKYWFKNKTFLMIAAELNHYQIVKSLVTIFGKSDINYIKIKNKDQKSAFNYALEFSEIHNENHDKFKSFDLLFPFSELNDQKFKEYIKSEIFQNLVKKHNKLFNSITGDKLEKSLEKFRTFHLIIDEKFCSCVEFKYEKDEISSCIISKPPNLSDSEKIKSSLNSNYYKETYYYLKNLNSTYGIDSKFFEKNTLKNIFDNKKPIKVDNISCVDTGDDSDNFHNYLGKKLKIFLVILEYDDGERELKNIIISFNNNLEEAESFYNSQIKNSSISIISGLTINNSQLNHDQNSLSYSSSNIYKNFFQQNQMCNRDNNYRSHNDLSELSNNQNHNIFQDNNSFSSSNIQNNISTESHSSNRKH